MQPFKFRVHGARKTETAGTAIVDGKAMTVSIPIFECELAPEGNRHGSLTLRFTGEEAAEAAEYFIADRVVGLSLEGPSAFELGAAARAADKAEESAR